MSHTAALIWHPRLAQYRFTPDHPLNPRRLELTLSLIEKARLLDDEHRIVSPSAATEEDILTVHAADYVRTVQRASAGAGEPAALHAFGLGSDDVPVVRGMHEMSLEIAGAALTAAELVMSGEVRRAFSIAGGLHHARRAEAAGFCVYNDLAVAIRRMQRHHGARVLCVDIDAHHGDGTQWIFYDDPDVLTLSFHESGAFLFPGTGFIDECGTGDGYGASVNMPLDPNTGDDSLLECVRTLLPDIARAFAPDVVVLQAGCDAHVLDPLTHLRCTTGVYEHIVQCISDVADAECNGRILATGGGGYAVHDVVPRAWTLVWAALCGVHADDPLPAAFIAEVERDVGLYTPRVLRDPPGTVPITPAQEQATANNRQTVDAVRRQVLPLISGWGLGF